LNCREFADFLNCYLDSDLSPEERKEFELHLEECPACVAYLDSYRKTVLLVQGSAPAEAAAMQQAPEELIQAILAARDPRKPERPQVG
jgi:anti-sigma factor RsiW